MLDQTIQSLAIQCALVGMPNHEPTSIIDLVKKAQEISDKHFKKHDIEGPVPIMEIIRGTRDGPDRSLVDTESISIHPDLKCSRGPKAVTNLTRLLKILRACCNEDQEVLCALETIYCV